MNSPVRTVHNDVLWTALYVLYIEALYGGQLCTYCLQWWTAQFLIVPLFSPWHNIVDLIQYIYCNVYIVFSASFIKECSGFKVSGKRKMGLKSFHFQKPWKIKNNNNKTASAMFVWPLKSWAIYPCATLFSTRFSKIILSFIEIFFLVLPWYFHSLSQIWCILKG